MVVSTIPKETTVGNVHHIVRQCQSSSLLVYAGLHSRNIDGATHPHLPRIDSNAHQDMRGSLYLGDGEDQPRYGIIDGCAGNAQRINVATRQR